LSLTNNGAWSRLNCQLHKMELGPSLVVSNVKWSLDHLIVSNIK